MTPLRFRSYNPGASDKHVIAEQVTYFEKIFYNGHIGTRIYLFGEVTVDVGECPSDVAKAVLKATSTPIVIDGRML